ncbi:MAG: hypothetical protein ABH827_06050 [bacterium]
MTNSKLNFSIIYTKIFFILTLSCIIALPTKQILAIKIQKPNITGLLVQISDTLWACAYNTTISIYTGEKNQLKLIKELEPKKNKYNKTIIGHNEPITILSYNKKHKTLISTDTDGDIWLWLIDFDANKIIPKHPIITPITGRSFATAHDATIIIWAPGETKLESIQTIMPIKNHTSEALCDTTKKHYANITQLAYSKEHKILASVDESGVIILWIMDPITSKFIPAQKIQHTDTKEIQLIWRASKPAFILLDNILDKKTMFALNPNTNKFEMLNCSCKKKLILPQNLSLSCPKLPDIFAKKVRSHNQARIPAVKNKQSHKRTRIHARQSKHIHKIAAVIKKQRQKLKD